MRRIPLWLVIFLPFMGMFSFLLFVWPFTQHWQNELGQSQQTALDIAANNVAAMLSEDSRFLDFIEVDTSIVRYRSVAITEEVTIDGRTTDWPEHATQSLGIDDLLEIHFPYKTQSLTYDLSIGSDQESLYLHYRVRDDFVVYRKLNNLSVHRNDHIQFSLRDRDGLFHRFTLAATQPGEVSILEVAANGRALRQLENVSARWLATEDGYHVELQLPRAMLGGSFSTLVADVDDEKSRDIKFMMGLSHTRQAEDLGRLLFSPTDLETVIAQIPYGVRVSDVSGRFIETSGYHITGPHIEAASSIDAGGRHLGTVSLRQTLDPSSYLFWTIWTQLLIALAATILVVGLISFFVLWLVGYKLGTVRNLLSSLVDNQGRVTQQSAEPGSDAVGELVRELSSTMNKVAQYNDYLERMASRLNHELRTPVSVVKSSLENVRAENLDKENAVYIDRATQGVLRLTNILNKMAEARRLEESLDEDEVMSFNLVDVISGCVAGYETAFGGKLFELNIETEQIPVTGIPELIAQMLDKLIDNAVEFSTSETIRIRLHVENEQALLRVINDGPGLRDDISAKLFESMVSMRDDKSGSHLGLGLYIARVIAEFHGGSLSIANREDASGVIVTFKVPLMRITAKLR